MHTQTSDTNIWRVRLFNITPIKRAHKARTCWYHQTFHLIYQNQIKEEYKKGMDRHNKKIGLLYKCIMAHTSAIWQQAVYIYHLPSPNCSTRAMQKSLTLNKKYFNCTNTLSSIQFRNSIHSDSTHLKHFFFFFNQLVHCIFLCNCLEHSGCWTTSAAYCFMPTTTLQAAATGPASVFNFLPAKPPSFNLFHSETVYRLLCHSTTCALIDWVLLFCLCVTC